MNFNSAVEKIDAMKTRGDTILRKRLLEVADNISNSARNGNRLLFFNEVLISLTSVLYEKNNGVLFNVDELSGRILIPVPWGASGHKDWGVSSWEAAILKNILYIKMRSLTVAPIYQYANDMHRWTINLLDFPTLDKALLHLKNDPVNLLEYENSYELLKDRRRYYYRK